MRERGLPASLLLVMAAATGLALRNVASAAEAELSGGVTIQILEAQPDLRQQQAKAALAVLVRYFPRTLAGGRGDLTVELAGMRRDSYFKAKPI